jgi:hypothetical protein
VGRPPKGAPWVRKDNPRSLFGTWGWLRREEGATNKRGAPKEGREGSRG